MGNPFDLPGPPFLVFYAVIGVLTISLMVWVRRAQEAGTSPGVLNDYLEIAFLRGGASEALRVATLTLIERGLLVVEAGTEAVRADRDEAARFVSRPTERAILEECRSASAVPLLLSNDRLVATVTAECEPKLVRLGLLPDDGQRTRRNLLLLAAGGAMVGVAVIKIAVALSRGRFNIELLLAEAGVFLILAYRVTHPVRTHVGDALLEDLRTLFAGLRARSQSLASSGKLLVAANMEGDDLALLAAVFGVGAALPIRPDAAPLFPKASADPSGGSCGSSCGSSGGSSCGGGGCSGGCGGCGS